MSLRIVITTLLMSGHSGTVLYTRDLTLELQRQGHDPVVYTWQKGAVCQELRQAGIQVVDKLQAVACIPDVIHAYQHPTARGVLLRFPATPAMYICHNHRSVWDTAPRHPHIRRYCGVSMLCVERLRNEGVPEDNIRLLFNFVDTRRFQPRPPLPKRPRRALIFSNYASATTHLPAVAEACRRAGLELDVIGERVGNAVARPEELLGRYDLVFAKAKAAMEAMAVGAAVVLCDFGGVGPMVTSAEFDRLRPLNFGFQALDQPLQPEHVLLQIDRYDPLDAERVRDRIRSCAGLDQAVRQIVEIYKQVIEEYAQSPAQPETRHAWRDGIALLRYGLEQQLMTSWWAQSRQQRDSFSKLPGAETITDWARHLLR